jgi:hypothetical protein
MWMLKVAAALEKEGQVLVPVQSGPREGMDGGIGDSHGCIAALYDPD